jgi:hypothetical protein
MTVRRVPELAPVPSVVMIPASGSRCRGSRPSTAQVVGIMPPVSFQVAGAVGIAIGELDGLGGLRLR